MSRETSRSFQTSSSWFWNIGKEKKLGWRELGQKFSAVTHGKEQNGIHTYQYLNAFLSWTPIPERSTLCGGATSVTPQPTPRQILWGLVTHSFVPASAAGVRKFANHGQLAEGRSSEEAVLTAPSSWEPGGDSEWGDLLGWLTTANCGNWTWKTAARLLVKNRI